MRALPEWVKRKGFSSWKAYMASIRPKNWRRKRRAPKSKNNPIAIYNPKEMRPRLDVSVRSKRARLRRRSPLKGYTFNPAGSRLVYASLREIRAEKGPGQIKPGGRRFWKHRFNPGSAEVRGLPDGSLWIRPRKGLRLWARQADL